MVTKDFSEPEFFAGIFAGLGVILGGILAWILKLKNSKYAGFSICYGSGLFPWILASQIISMFLTVFIFDFVRYLNAEVRWVPTFITIVGISPAIILLYGGGIKQLLTSTILASSMSFPIAYWMSNTIIPVLRIPGAVANVATMAVTGFVICAICRVLPWMEKKQVPEVEENQDTDPGAIQKTFTPLWSLRRALADFSEPQFYGNEVVSIVIFVGLIVEWIINPEVLAGGASEAIPYVVLTQFIAGGTGVFLYASKYVEQGWYATYVPVVCASPACVLMFGATFEVAIIAGVAGGIIGAPLAEVLNKILLPNEDFHGTIGNVSAMVLSTIILCVFFQAIGF